MVKNNSSWSRLTTMACTCFHDDPDSTNSAAMAAHEAEETTAYVRKDEQYDPYIEGMGEEAEAATQVQVAEGAVPSQSRCSGDPAGFIPSMADARLQSQEALSLITIGVCASPRPSRPSTSTSTTASMIRGCRSPRSRASEACQAPPSQGDGDGSPLRLQRGHAAGLAVVTSSALVQGDGDASPLRPQSGHVGG
jgi:hypothetical protein